MKGLLSFFLIGLTTLALAEEAVDAEIIKNFEFFSQLDLIQNMELATQLDTLLDDSPQSPDTPPAKAKPGT